MKTAKYKFKKDHNGNAKGKECELPEGIGDHLVSKDVLEKVVAKTVKKAAPKKEVKVEKAKMEDKSAK